MSKPTNYTDEEILLALIWSMPNRMTKGQIGRVLGIKSAGQKHWSTRFQRLKQKGLISNHALDTGSLFFGSPIRQYYLTEMNLEQIWRHYFIHYDERHNLVNDPFLTPFSAGIWNVTSSAEFSKLVGSKFNYHFLCAKNTANPAKPKERIGTLGKEKIWKVMDAVLSIAWKTEAYIRKPVLMETLNANQKKAFGLVKSVYDQQAMEHPQDFKKFKGLFAKNFKYYV